MEAISPEQLRSIILTQYQLRSPLEHQVVTELFLNAANYSLERARLLSFFATTFGEEENGSLLELTPQTILLRKPRGTPTFQLQVKEVASTIKAEESELVIWVPGEAVRKCETLGWPSPQTEIKVLQSFLLLEDIPKKKMYSLLRHCQIVSLRHGDIFFKEGSNMNNCYYLVRLGQFSFSTAHYAFAHQSQRQLLRFRAGYIFQHQHKTQNNYQQYLGKCDVIDTSFDYTTKCKSSRGILYCIDSTVFDMQLLKFCREKLNKHLKNQGTFLAKTPAHNNPFSSFSSFKRPSSQQLLPLTAPNISSARTKPVLVKQERVLDLSEKNSEYRVVKEELPRRNRLFSKQELKKLIPDPEEDESGALIWKKVKCQRMKEVMGSTIKTSRGQILFNFTKSSIQLEKHKKRPSLL